VSILEAIRGGWTGRVEPELIDDSSEPIHAGVTIAAVAGIERVAGLLDVGKIDAVSVGALHDRIQAQVRVAFIVASAGAGIIGGAADAADVRVQAGVVDV